MSCEIPHGCDLAFGTPESSGNDVDIWGRTQEIFEEHAGEKKLVPFALP